MLVDNHDIRREFHPRMTRVRRERTVLISLLDALSAFSFVMSRPQFPKSCLCRRCLTETRVVWRKPVDTSFGRSGAHLDCGDQHVARICSDIISKCKSRLDHAYTTTFQEIPVFSLWISFVWEAKCHAFSGNVTVDRCMKLLQWKKSERILHKGQWPCLKWNGVKYRLPFQQLIDVPKTVLHRKFIGFL